MEGLCLFSEGIPDDHNSSLQLQNSTNNLQKLLNYLGPTEELINDSNCIQKYLQQITASVQ